MQSEGLSPDRITYICILKACGDTRARYVEQGKVHEALECFELMRNEGIIADVVIFACILKACGSTQSISMGEEIHAEVRKHGLLGKHIMICNALVDMHAKCGSISPI